MTERELRGSRPRRVLGRPLALALSTFLIAAPAAAASEELVLLPSWPMLALLLVLFGSMIPLIDRIVLRPLLVVLDEREERIAGTRRRGERLAREASTVLERYERAIAEARNGAEGERKQRVSQARERNAEQLAIARAAAEQELGRARGEVAGALAEARGLLRAQARELGREAAASVLGRPLS